MKEIFLIEKAWIDPMENRVADGYDPIGFVNTIEEAQSIVDKGGNYTPKDCWSIQFCTGKILPKFRYKILDYVEQ